MTANQEAAETFKTLIEELPESTHIEDLGLSDLPPPAEYFDSLMDSSASAHKLSQRPFQVHDLLTCTPDFTEKMAREGRKWGVMVETTPGKSQKKKKPTIKVRLVPLLRMIILDCLERRDFRQYQELLNLADRKPESNEEKGLVEYIKAEGVGPYSEQSFAHSMAAAKYGHHYSRQILIRAWIYLGTTGIKGMNLSLMSEWLEEMIESKPSVSEGLVKNLRNAEAMKMIPTNYSKSISELTSLIGIECFAPFKGLYFHERSIPKAGLIRLQDELMRLITLYFKENVGPIEDEKVFFTLKDDLTVFLGLTGSKIEVNFKNVTGQIGWKHYDAEQAVSGGKKSPMKLVREIRDVILFTESNLAIDGDGYWSFAAK